MIFNQVLKIHFNEKLFSKDFKISAYAAACITQISPSNLNSIHFRDEIPVTLNPKPLENDCRKSGIRGKTRFLLENAKMWEKIVKSNLHNS